MAEEQEFGSVGEIWLTGEEVNKLLRGDILWHEVEADRARAEARVRAEALAAEYSARETTVEQAGPETPPAAAVYGTAGMAVGTAEYDPVDDALAPAERGVAGAADGTAAMVDDATMAADDTAETAAADAATGTAADTAEAIGTADAPAADRAEMGKNPWECTPEEREILWPLPESGFPDWMKAEKAEPQSVYFQANEMKQILTEETTDLPSSIWRGAKLVGLMLALAAATFGVWWYFIY
ncbi:MAG: hypothetical protein LBK56_11685 [Gracilibacteraceae bacterium]|jgi:hypothetical protein|nr:hypothetical protein [Gracilibacteraceae bacterium]